jgi:SAM-dependent methyltransferase
MGGAPRVSAHPWVPGWAKPPARRARRAFDDARDRLRGRPVPPWSLRSQVAGDFRAVGSEYAGYMVDLGGLRPDDRVLDIGCRAGRLAVPLLDRIGPHGRYEGVDSWPEGVAWCRRAITPRHRNFRFQVVPREVGPAAGDPVPLPFEDGTFDFVVFVTVSALSRRAFDHYLSECARLLRVSGTYLGAWYLLAGSSDPDRLPSPVACTEEDARRRLTSLGIQAAAVYRGSWDGHLPALSYTDVVVGRKAG